MTVVDEYTVTVQPIDEPAAVAITEDLGQITVHITAPSGDTTVLIEQPVETIAIAPDQVVDVAVEDPASLVITVDDVPSGPAGPPGPSGGATAAYVHSQTIPATVWAIDHGLDYDPAGVSVTSDDGWLIDGYGVQYMGAGQLRLSFDIPLAGTARLS